MYKVTTFGIPRENKASACAKSSVLESKSKNFNYKLSTTLLSFVSITLILGVLFVSIWNYSDRSEKICLTAKCIRSAALLKAVSDWNTDPCDDFYKFACGRWSEKYPLHPSYRTYSKFQLPIEKINAAILRFLSAKNDINDIKPVRQCRTFFKSCLDLESREALGFETLFKYLKIVGLPVVPKFFSNDDDKNNFKLNWMKIEAKVKKLFHMDVLFGFGVFTNDYNETENLMFLRTPLLKCPMKRPYKIKSQVPAWEGIVKFVMSEIIRNVTEVPQDELLNEAAEIINNMTSAIIEMQNIPENYTENEKIFTSYKFRELQDIINDYTFEKINLTIPDFLQKYVGYVYGDINEVTIDFDKDLISVVDKEKMYILKMVSYLQQTSNIYIELYLWWSTVICMSMNTSPDIEKYIEKKAGSFRPKEQTKRITSARKLHCAEEVTDFMNLAVTYGIAKQIFSTSDGSDIKNMIEKIRLAFVDSIKDITWMDEPTKSVTLQKLRNIFSFIGLPEWIFEEGKLAEYYAGIEIMPTAYLNNKLEIIRTEMPKILRRLRTPNDIAKIKDFPDKTTVVNAFYMPHINSIIIPLGILTFPFYHLGLSVLDYGSIGAILGHELTHGFDNKGSQRDQSGNLRRWWSNSSIQMFRKKSKCFLYQYDSQSIKGVKGRVSGLRTLGENIADNGGLNHAFAAYKKYGNFPDDKLKLPGFENFTSDQMFFIGFGNLWCKSASPEQIEKQLSTDVHSPGILRINMVVSNSEDFAKAFNCPVGSPMNPQKKCKIW